MEERASSGRRGHTSPGRGCLPSERTRLLEEGSASSLTGSPQLRYLGTDYFVMCMRPGWVALLAAGYRAARGRAQGPPLHRHYPLPLPLPFTLDP